MWGTVIALALRMLLNQTQVQSLAHSKVDLLMEACSEAKCRSIERKQKSSCLVVGWGAGSDF